MAAEIPQYALPKYALLENERRFLVLRAPDLAGARVRLIEDRYLDAGRLRLRRITHFDGHAPEHKLCKKYGSADPASEPIVNIYLTPEEHAAFAALPGRPLRKRRYTARHDGRAFSVDVFEAALAGLVMCEAEAATPEAIRALAFPPWAAREVTGDSFFSGGHLATLTAEALAARLSAESGLP
jgi:CYTH domain-containing protein